NKRAGTHQQRCRQKQHAYLQIHHPPNQKNHLPCDLSVLCAKKLSREKTNPRKNCVPTVLCAKKLSREKMLNFTNTTLTGLSIHQVGNKSESQEIRASKETTD